MNLNEEKKSGVVFKKPSNLSKTLFYEDLNSRKLSNLTPTQVDVVNALFYFLTMAITELEIEMDQVDFWANNNHFLISLNSICGLMGKFDNRVYDVIIGTLLELNKVQIVSSDVIDKKITKETYFSLIRKISFEKEKQTTLKHVHIWVEPEIIKMIKKSINFYTLFNLQMLFSLKSKYSKLLYDVVKSSKCESIKIDYSQLLLMLNVEDSKMSWAIFNRDIFKRIINEINTRTDIEISAYPVKSIKNGKKKVYDIEFNVTTKFNEPRLIVDSNQPQIKVIGNNDMNDSSEKDHLYDIFTDSIITENDVSNIKYFIAENKINSLPEEVRAKIYNPKQYLTKIVESLDISDQNLYYKISIKNYISKLKTLSDKNKPGTKLICFSLYSDIPYIVLSNDFNFYNLTADSKITTTLEETINIINRIIEKGVSPTFLDVKNVHTKFGISLVDNEEN